MIPHFYDFSVVRFKLPSRERLVKRLGEYDALAEFAVLSFYDFETIARSVQDTYKFVCDKAREYDVKIKGTVSMENYHEALYKSFMINTYAMFAEFIENVREDIRILVNPDFVFVDDNNISDYERLKRSLETIDVYPPIPKWLEQIEEYYRLVRNHVAHNGGDDENCGHEGDRTGEDKGEVSGVTDGVMYNHRIEERNEEHFDDHPREIL